MILTTFARHAAILRATSSGRRDDRRMTRILAAVLCTAWISPPAASAVEVLHSNDGIVRIDWQYPPQLPPRFRNHCTFEYFTVARTALIIAASIISFSIARTFRSAAAISAAAIAIGTAFCAAIRKARCRGSRWNVSVSLIR
jgi:hypothetical protein